MWTIYKKQRKNKKIKETGDSRYIYQNGLDKACFLQDMAYEDFKDLTRRTASNKMLCDKAINITQNPKYDGYQRGLASMVYNFLIKNPLCLQINLLPVEQLKTKIFQTKNYLKNCRNQLLENSRKEKYTQLS